MKASNIENGKRIAITHGELALVPVESMPSGKTTSHKLYIAAHSESGHNHVIESKTEFDIIERGNERFMLVKEVPQLFHQKTFDIHETRTLAPGMYQLFQKTEYDPFAQVIRQVWD